LVHPLNKFCQSQIRHGPDYTARGGAQARADLFVARASRTVPGLRPVLMWLEVTKQLRQGNPEADRQHFEDAQTSLPAPILQLGDVDPPNS
jgi:hypothetical protein